MIYRNVQDKNETTYTYRDSVTREKFRIIARNGIEARAKFEWVNERLDDDEVRGMGFDPDTWDLEDVQDVTYD